MCSLKSLSDNQCFKFQWWNHDIASVVRGLRKVHSSVARIVGHTRCGLWRPHFLSHRSVVPNRLSSVGNRFWQIPNQHSRNQVWILFESITAEFWAFVEVVLAVIVTVTGDIGGYTHSRPTPDITRPTWRRHFIHIRSLLNSLFKYWRHFTPWISKYFAVWIKDYSDHWTLCRNWKEPRPLGLDANAPPSCLRIVAVLQCPVPVLLWQL